MARPDLRRNDEMRKVKIITDYTMYAEGSVLICVGNTKVICFGRGKCSAACQGNRQGLGHGGI